jgi:SAM-dependent methyltransferase
MTVDLSGGQHVSRERIVVGADGAGYHQASRLRQARDQDWVLSRAPGHARSLLDLGCGTGALLEAALERLPRLRKAVGLEASPARAREARSRLAVYGDRVTVRAADLLSGPDLADRFDLITMTSVVHWLYPREDEVLGWVARHLAQPGAFLITTYHPVTSRDGLGGTDELVQEALGTLGVTDVPGALAAHGIAPIGLRNRPVSALEDLLRAHFTIEAAEERPATVKVSDAGEYQRFHAATFGTYYSQVAGDGRQEEFLRALGAAAMRRMRRQGYVTSMPVRLWACTGQQRQDP